MEKARILIVDDSETTLFKLKAILIQRGYQVTAHTNPPEALAWLKNTDEVPDLIISDVNMPAMDGFEFVRNLRAYPPTKKIPVILLTGLSDFEDKIKGLQAGADDYLTKTVSAAEIDLRIQALLTRTKGQEETFTYSAARTISVFSLRGGVGTTSLAVNLAIAIAQLRTLEVTLLDMAMNGGNCGVFLNVHTPNTLAQLADWDEPNADGTVLTKLFVRHDSGVKLLTGANTPVESELITKETIDSVWSQVQGSSNYLVVDAGSRLNDPVITVLRRSDVILLVLAPEILSVKRAADALKIFNDLGFPPGKVILVINQTFPEHTLPVPKIQAVLKHLASVEIPYDTDQFVYAMQTGKPLVISQPKSKPAMAIITLAYRLSSKGKGSKKSE